MARGEPAATLSLPAGEIPGTLIGAGVGGDGALPTIRWQSSAFDGPFEFPLDGVNGISFPVPSDVIGPVDGGGDWRIELIGGDQLIGRLVSIDDREIALAIGPAGDPIRVPLRRKLVRSIVPHDGGKSFVWNGTLDQLQTSAPADWVKKGSGLASTIPGAMLTSAAGTEARTRYDVSLSWSEPPVLRISLGGPPTAKANAPGESTMGLAGYRIELADKTLVVVRDAATADGRGQADVALCGDLPASGLTLSVFIDRAAGRIAVVRPGSAEPIADLSIEPPAMPVTNNRGGFLPESDSAATGLRLDVVSGGVTLERLRIAPWRDEKFSSADDEVGGVDLVEGVTIAGIVEGIAAGTTELVVRLPDGSARQVAVDTVKAIRFPAADGPIGDDAAKLRDRVRFGDRFGSSLTATLVSAGDGSVTFLHPAIDGPVTVPIGILRSIDGIESRLGDHQLPGRIGRLAIGESSHRGCLVPIDADPDAPGRRQIGWQPLGSLTAAPFAGQADGTSPPATITYGDASKEAANDPVQHGWIGHAGTVFSTTNSVTTTHWSFQDGPLVEAGVRSGSIVSILAVAPMGDGRFIPTENLAVEDVALLLEGRAGTPVQIRIPGKGVAPAKEISVVRIPHPSWGVNPQRLSHVLQAHVRLLALESETIDQSAADWFGSVLILVTGESIACQIESIDEEVVRIRQEGAESVTVPNAMVKAAELVPVPGATISPEKFRTLTTLPRSQQQAPPTHLVRSLRGDYLRGRLMGMGDETIQIAVEAAPRGKPLVIPRSEVARVIWLHPETLEEQWQPPAIDLGPGLPMESFSGEALMGLRWRMRMSALAIDGNVLLGRHPVLGDTRIDVEKIDRLLIGGAPVDPPMQPPFASWQLRPAPEPRNLPPSKPAAN